FHHFLFLHLTPLTFLSLSSFFFFFFFFNLTSTTEIYTLSLHDALPISFCDRPRARCGAALDHERSAHGQQRDGRLCGASRRSERDRKSTRLNSSHVAISYAVFCLKKKKKKKKKRHNYNKQQLCKYKNLT